MKKILSTIAVAAALFIGHGTYNTLNERELTNIALSNVEALANEGEGASAIEFWCCGNTCTCAKGEEIVIHGHLSKNPCK